MFAPDSVSVPVPILVSDTTPLPSCRTPLNVDVHDPMVSVAALVLLLVTVPAPDKPQMLLE